VILLGWVGGDLMIFLGGGSLTSIVFAQIF